LFVCLFVCMFVFLTNELVGKRYVAFIGRMQMANLILDL